MYGTLAGALSVRKIPYERDTYSATVDGRIAGIDKTIRIESIVVHYELTIPGEFREAAERAWRTRHWVPEVDETSEDVAALWMAQRPVQGGGAPRPDRLTRKWDRLRADGRCGRQ